MTSGIVMIDRSGVILLLNRMAETLLGVSARELLGRHFAEIRQQDELLSLIRDASERREHRREELAFYYPEERQIEIHFVPIEGRDGNGGMLLVLQDMTAIRKLERMRSEFVANVSHELKTPIAAVKGFAETLLGGAGDDPETRRAFLQIIHEESERLNRLVNDILELSKIESRRAPLHFSPVELGPFIAKTVELLAKEAERKQIRIETEVGDALYVEADEDRLRQIVVNVLSNAINYTPEGGLVRIRVEPVAARDGAGADKRDTSEADARGQTPAASDAREPAAADHGRHAPFASAGEYDAVRIRISDNGIGIPKKDLPRIFERFYRVDKARSRSSGGTGLGLSIAKHLVELHHGTIAVESTVGAGSTFTIELPVLQESAGEAGLFLQ
jgi:two-component system phosphate regulon sensor histidine kinase PhoR